MTTLAREAVSAADARSTTRASSRKRRVFALVAVGTSVVFSASVAMGDVPPPAAPPSGLSAPPAASPLPPDSPGAVEAPLDAPVAGAPPAPPMPAEMLAPPPAMPNTAPGLPEPPRSMEEPSRIPSYLLWAAGGASLVVGAAFGIAAISAKSDFDDKPTYERADAVHSRAILSDVGFGLGLILVATGTVFYFGGAESGTPPRQAMNKHAGTRSRLGAAPLVGRGTGGGLLTLQF